MMAKPAFLKVGTLVPLVLFGLLATVPVLAKVFAEPFYVTFFARVLIYAIAATALNLAMGYGGLVSLGHALFFGLGAYSVAIPAFYGIDSGWVHLAVAIGMCAMVGLVTGIISLRTAGVGFIMITLAFAQMGYFVFVSLKHYGGDDGTTISATSKLFGLDLGEPNTVYLAALAVLGLATWAMARLRVAPFGMVLRGARQNARRINAIGLDSHRYQLSAYVLSAVLCGIAGFLLANLNAFASPNTLAWTVSGDLIVMVVLGGLGSIFGPLLGALAFLGLEEILKSFTEYWLVIFGPIVLLMALVGKRGIAGLLAAAERKSGAGIKDVASAAPLARPRTEGSI